MLLNEMDEVHKALSELIIELENKPEIIWRCLITILLHMAT